MQENGEKDEEARHSQDEGTAGMKGKPVTKQGILKVKGKEREARDKRRAWLKNKLKEGVGSTPSAVQLAASPPMAQKEMLAGPLMGALRNAGVDEVMEMAGLLLEDDNMEILSYIEDSAKLLETVAKTFREGGNRTEP